MKLPEAWPRLMRPPVAETYVGGREVLEILKSRGLRATIQRRKLTLYLKDRIDAAVTKLDQEESDVWKIPEK